MWKMDPMSGFDIRLVFTLPPRESTQQYKRCVHFWNNFPCITSLLGATFITLKIKPSTKLLGVFILWKTGFHLRLKPARWNYWHLKLQAYKRFLLIFFGNKYQGKKIASRSPNINYLFNKFVLEFLNYFTWS